MEFKPYFHLQQERFVADYCQLSGRAHLNVAGFHVVAKRRKWLGYVNAFIYAPEAMRDFTPEDAKAFGKWLSDNSVGNGVIYSSQKMDFLPLAEASTGGTLFLDLSRPEDELRANLEQRCRTAIKKAEKGGVTVEFEDGAECLDAWYGIYTQLGVDRRFSRQDLPVLRGLMEKGWGRLFTVKLHKQLLGGVYCVFAGGYAIPLAAAIGGNADSRRLSPGNLLFWEIIRHYKQLGGACLDFMSANDDPNHGPTRFKRSFGGQFVRMYHYALVGSRWRHWLYALVEKHVR